MDRPKVVVVDDNPEHLKLYSLILEHGGFAASPSLASRTGVTLPDVSGVRLAVLDYNLNCTLATVDVARLLRERYPGVAVLLLSDVFGMPSEMVDVANTFVRKGNPKKLVEEARKLAGLAATA